MFEFEVFRKKMCCIEESTCDIVWTFWRPRSHSAFPEVIWRLGNYAHLSSFVRPLRPYKCQLVLLGFEKNEAAAVANAHIVSFRPKLDDCMFKMFSWHCTCLQGYSSIMQCSRCQNCSFCDSLCSNFVSCFFHIFDFRCAKRRFKNCECW